MNMAQSGETYRKLPGRLRGFGYGASVWMGSDHLLLVRTHMFREEYKRFYLRDIQAIVVADRPRFVVSLTAVGLFVLWLFAGLFMSIAPASFLTVYLAVAAALLLAWLYVCISHRCPCRIFTAVSRDEIPS